MSPTKSKQRDRVEYNKAWRAAHQKHLQKYERSRNAEKREHHKSYYERHKAKVLAHAHAYRASNIEKIRAYDRNRPNNKERRRKHLELQKQARLEVIMVYGGKCTCCGEHYPELLNIDHVNGNGSKHRKEAKCNNGYGMYVWLKRHGFPRDNYQLLCFNCNWAKSRYGKCPHQTGTSVVSKPFAEVMG